MAALSDLQIADELERFVLDQFPATTSGGVARDVDLFDSGIIDSVGVAETLAHIEERYEVQIPDEVLLSEDFTSIDGMARSIAALRANSR